MSWSTVRLLPGANVEETPTLLQAGYARTANGRFKAGLFQKLGGWQKYVDVTFSGAPYSLWGWQDLNLRKWLSVATSTTVTAIVTGLPAVITPQQLQTDTTPDFSTTAGSNIVTIQDPNISGITVDDMVELLTPVAVGGLILSGNYPIIEIVGLDTYRIAAFSNAVSTVSGGGSVPQFVTTSGSSNVAVNLTAHGQVVGQTVVFPLATSVGGLVIHGKYTVIGVATANQFTIAADEVATSSASVTMNGGEVEFLYYIALGPSGGGVGYGVGPYGEGAYGKGTSGSAGQVGIPITADDWTQDNWGEILIATPKDGAIYYWQPGSGYQNLKAIGTGPMHNIGAMVSMAQQQIIAWGSTVDARLGGGIGIYQDPLLVQWSDVGNFFQWTPTEANFARNYRIPTGSRCIGGAASKNRNLIWTDTDLHAFVWNGGENVYTPNRVGSNCGLIGMHAWAQQADTVYWMGVGNFFNYAGAGVTAIPCSVWDAVFQNLHPDFQHRVVCGSNSDFTEIMWFYPSLTGLGLLDLFAKFNILEQTFDIGPMDRCAWLDRSVLGNPIGITSGGIVYAHERGFNDDAVPLVPFMQTGDFYLAEGEEFTFIDEVWPDFKWGPEGGSENAQIQVSVLCRDAPGDPYREYGPFLVTKQIPTISPANPDGTRPRARQMALRVTSNDMDSFWRLGAVRFRGAPDGRR